MRPADKNDWQTPPALIPVVEKAIGRAFDLDLCATPGTEKAPAYFAPPGTRSPWPMGCVGVNGLSATLPGEGLTVWCNPPYGRGQIARWTRRCQVRAWNGHLVVGLLPFDPSTEWWHADVMKADRILAPQRRLRFLGGPTGATRPSALVVWEPNLRQSAGAGRVLLEALYLTPEAAGQR